MAALPRADLPPGAHHDLVAALHGLHHRAGWPSLRTLAGRAGCSHTTVSAVFSTPKLPSWGVLELVVEAMDGDSAAFHRLWLAAGTRPETGESTRPGIAGRGSELATVRHHVAGGTGLLLVTGEAGIGKTTLVVEATRAAGVVVATGHCLPLSGQVPLLPVLDALTAIQDADAAWFEQAVAGLPAFVERSLARLLPQLSDRTPLADAGELARHHLLGSVETVLERLTALRPLVLVVEDLHWADPTDRKSVV